MKREHKYVLDDNGVPRPCADIIEWATWYESTSNRSVHFHVIDTVQVSTVFLGIADITWCMGFGPEEPPPMFETLVQGGVHDGERERYHTKVEAQVGHARWLTRVLATTPRLSWRRA